MRLSKKTIAVLGIGLAIFVLLIYIYAMPVVNTVYIDMKAYETRIAYRDNYKLHTTPLSKDVVDDICSKLGIKASSDNCKPDAVVYAPDFFDEIKAYFNGLPDESKTYKTVRDILGTYLIYCGQPDLDGRFRCRYDLRGDNVYPIAFYFDKNGMYYRIIANTGGS